VPNLVSVIIGGGSVALIVAGSVGTLWFVHSTWQILQAKDAEPAGIGLTHLHGTPVSVKEQAELLEIWTDVDGIYSADPRQDPTAERFTHITYLEALQRNLRVMDASALSLCMDNAMPIVVFDFQVAGNIERAVRGEAIGTTISPALQPSIA